MHSSLPTAYCLPPTAPAAILFDMDGTLTEPLLDFPKLKAEMGIGTRPILEALAELEGSQRDAALAVLQRHEERAAFCSTLNPGCRELLEALRACGVKIALITRNSRDSVRTVIARHQLQIEVLVAREDAPPKPSPEPLRVACQRLEVPEASAWMVGDGQYDIEAGNAAGIYTVWLSHGRVREFQAKPRAEVRDLWELKRIVCGE